MCEYALVLIKKENVDIIIITHIHENKQTINQPSNQPSNQKRSTNPAKPSDRSTNQVKSSKQPTQHAFTWGSNVSRREFHVESHHHHLT